MKTLNRNTRRLLTAPDLPPAYRPALNSHSPERDLSLKKPHLESLGESVQQAVRRGELPPIDPGLIKLMTAENKVRSGDLAMALRGPEALVGDTAETTWSQVELMGRFAISIGGGTNEVLRNNVGERTLGLPRDPGFDKSLPWRDIPR